MANTPAQAWWSSEWPIRKKITIDTSDKGMAIGDGIGTTAVLIRLVDGNFQFASAKDDGSDIRFVAADDKTLLSYHIEKYDSLMSEAFVWVKVPDVKPGAQTTFWLYYGNTGGKADRVEDAKGTYDADTVLVYHFTEKNAPARDYSSAGNNAQTAGVSVDGSMIGAGLRFDGKSTVTLPDAASLAWTDGGSMTWTAWVKLSTLQPSAPIYTRKDGGKGLVIGADNGVPYIELNGQRSAAGTPLVVNTWHHFGVVSDGTKTTLYIDGESYGTVAGALPALSTAATLGGFNGELDELQISKAARPAGAIKLAAAGQGDKSTKLLAFGEDEQTHSWFEGGTFGVIIKSLTVDGWVVICILAVMSIVSWIVMFSKVSYLNSIGRGNDLFMKEWRHLAADLTVLDHGDPEQVKTLGGRADKSALRSIRQSSLYRIFHIGSEEIRHRLSVDRNGANKVLSAQSIEAIRASLHTGLVREGQKLSNLMVVLTISISGGPFLGLLGTVVGVMITFAAIAQAGDVNVNAIAPGIAAALLATIAGLAVAIPALFGYNYILLRVKDANSDMAVFVDEFVARMAEFYSGEIDHSAKEDDTYASPGR